MSTPYKGVFEDGGEEGREEGREGKWVEERYTKSNTGLTQEAKRKEEAEAIGQIQRAGRIRRAPMEKEDTERLKANECEESVGCSALSVRRTRIREVM